MRAGDRRARQRLILGQHGSLMRLIRADLGGALRELVQPEDVLQDVYIEVLRDFDAFRGVAKVDLERWIRAIARNRIRKLDRWHRQTARRGAGMRKRSGSLSECSVVLAENLKRQLTSISGRAVRVEALDALAAALALLPAHYREVIELRYLQELSVEETASKTGRTSGSVLMICHRALREMAGMIEGFPLLTRS